jgi:hypothetical protein
MLGPCGTVDTAWAMTRVLSLQRLHAPGPLLTVQDNAIQHTHAITKYYLDAYWLLHGKISSCHALAGSQVYLGQVGGRPSPKDLLLAECHDAWFTNVSSKFANDLSAHGNQPAMAAMTRSGVNFPQKILKRTIDINCSLIH